MLHITAAEYLGDYRVRVKFNDGREGVGDLQPMVSDDETRSVFAALKDPTVFRQLAVRRGTLCWPNEVDVAPEYIYFLTFRGDKDLRELFQKWGYIQSPVTV